MLIRRYWKKTVIFATFLHILLLFLIGSLLVIEDTVPLAIGEDFTWLDIEQVAKEDADSAPKLIEEVPLFPKEEAVDELFSVEDVPKEPKAIAVSPQEKTAPTATKVKTEKQREYPTMRKPNKPAVLQEETKRGLDAKETSYRGKVQFFVDISQEGRVSDIQAWQFEPEIHDEKERSLLKERLKKIIEEHWRYAPSLTPEGVATTQTKSETLEIPTALSKKAQSEDKQTAIK